MHANRAVEIRYFRAHFDGDGDALNDLAGGRVDNVNAEHSAGRCVDDDLVEGALVRLEMENRRSIEDMQRLGSREQVPGRERICTWPLILCINGENRLKWMATRGYLAAASCSARPTEPICKDGMREIMALVKMQMVAIADSNNAW
jgi:hypothetical protein